jgi:hypothetical protein
LITILLFNPRSITRPCPGQLKNWNTHLPESLRVRSVNALAPLSPVSSRHFLVIEPGPFVPCEAGLLLFLPSAFLLPASSAAETETRLANQSLSGMVTNFLCRLFGRCDPKHDQQTQIAARADLGQNESKDEALSKELLATWKAGQQQNRPNARRQSRLSRSPEKLFAVTRGVPPSVPTTTQGADTMNKTILAIVASAGFLIGGNAIAAENTSGSVPFSPSALGSVPFQSIPNCR